jgi:sugar lactone lactonase YvrE
MTRLSFLKRFILCFIFIFLVNCNPPQLNNPCDITSKSTDELFASEFLRNNSPIEKAIVQYVSKDKISFCQLGVGGGSYQYGATKYVFFAGTSITSLSPTVTSQESIKSYSVSPSLPSGLSLSPETGAITGTPTTAQLTTNYTFTAIRESSNLTVSLPITIKGTTATRVYGQFGNFTSNTANNGGISADSLSNCRGIALDPNGNLYIASGINARILYYTKGSTTASRVYGQFGNFTANTINNGGITANSLQGAYRLLTDSSGNLYANDWGNNRVLFYANGSTTATKVYGTSGSFTVAGAGITADSLILPQNLALDSSGNLYIVDAANNRVLYYASGSTTATRVYGQLGNFGTATSNNGGISADSLSNPSGVALDPSGNLWVTDLGNNRILVYPPGSTTATQVLGQPNFTSFAASTTASTFSAPSSIIFDANGNFYVAEEQNNRILYFPAGNTIATRVYGQLGNFNSGLANITGVAVPTAESLSFPISLAIDSDENLYVTDNNNNRVLMY